jgi:hypothetical protein
MWPCASPWRLLLGTVACPSDEQDVDDFLVALRSFGYVVERLDHRTGDE